MMSLNSPYLNFNHLADSSRATQSPTGPWLDLEHPGYNNVSGVWPPE